VLERKVFGFALKWVLLAAVAIVLVGFVIGRIIGGNHQEVRQAQTEVRSAEAMQEAGQAAVATVLEQAKEEADLKDLVAEAAKEIDNAPNPAAARAAALDAACQLRLYRDDPACQLRPADTP
jgi:hypothetical protein